MLQVPKNVNKYNNIKYISRNFSSKKIYERRGVINMYELIKYFLSEGEKGTIDIYVEDSTLITLDAEKSTIELDKDDRIVLTDFTINNDYESLLIDRISIEQRAIIDVIPHFEMRII